MPQLNRREFLKTTTRSAVALGALRAARPFARPAAAAVQDEFVRLDGLAQAELVRAGKVTASELLEAAIARAEALNPKLNAIVTPMYELARARAAGPLPDGPFTGVPTLLKDLIEYAGVKQTFGSRFFKDFVPEKTHPVPARMERAGMVPFGKTNTPEFGFLPTTESYLLGPAHNPWNLDYSPGGSSGGSATAVAAGIVPIAQASDGGGSIRVPACNCGLFGMKVTRDRLPELPARKDRPGGLSVRGFVSRTVRDNLAALQAVALTPEEGSPLPPLAYAEGIHPCPLRIAFSTRHPRGDVIHPECVKAVEKAAALCDRLGHAVEEAAPPIDGEAFYHHFMTFWSAFARGVITDVTALMEGQAPPREAFEPWTWGLDEYFRGLPEDAIAAAEHHMLMVTGQMAAFHQRYDVWLTPVLGSPPVRIGEISQEPPFPEVLEQLTQYVAFTPLANATGQPAMTVPLHWTEDGLPVGAHFMARPGEEAPLFALAAQLEAAQPWADRWAPNSAGKA